MVVGEAHGVGIAADQAGDHDPLLEVSLEVLCLAYYVLGTAIVIVSAVIPKLRSSSVRHG